MKNDNAKTAIDLSLQIATRSRFVPSRAALRRWARAMPKQYANARVTVRIVGTPEAKRLNRDYRGRDYATNVLTFVYGNEAGKLTGDLVLCAPVVAREAREQGKTLDAHYAHLFVHGLLHLFGHDHVKKTEAERMEKLETRILKSLGYADPYVVQ